MKTLHFGILAVLALSVVGGCRGGGASNEILATVNGDSITMDTFNKYLALKPTARVIVQNQVADLPVADTLAFQAMQDLVSRTILLQIAKDNGVVPTEKEVDDEIEFQKQLNPNFLANFQARGMNVAQIKEEVRYSLVQEKIVTKGVNVTDAEVDDWIKANPKAFVVPESYELSWVLATTDARKAQIDAALKEGGKFTDVAVKLSQAPNAAVARGRYMPEQGPIPVIRMVDALKKALTGKKEGEETDWIKFTEGWAKFTVDKRNPEQTLEVTDARKKSIKRSLAMQRGSKASDLRTQMVDRIQKADIQIRREALKKEWANFAELLRRQAEQSAGGPANTEAPQSGEAPKDGAPKTTGG